MNISAALVKELRERTNEGMMECKKALLEANGDIELAIENMRKAGQAKAMKRAVRVAAEGTLAALLDALGKHAVLLEVNCETDFVAREARFQQFAKDAALLALEGKIQDLAQLQERMETARLELVSTLGENVSIRRLSYQATQDGTIGIYAHGDANGVRIGALVVLKNGTPNLARDLAMQVAAMHPEYLKADDIPANRMEKEKEIFMEQTREEGKPENMLDKIVAGKLKKFATDISLLGQSFVKEPSKTIEALLKEQGAEIERFVRFEVGEGIEKKQDNFAAEVMAQVKGN